MSIWKFLSTNMDVDSESEFLVVDLENCVSADIRNLNKNNIYCNSISPGNSHDIRLATTGQNLSTDLNQSLCRIQLPLHYQQFQVNYDGSNTNGLSPLYQNSTLENYSPTLGYSSPYLQSLSPLDQASIPDPSTSPPPNSPTPPPNSPSPPPPNSPTPPPNSPTPQNSPTRPPNTPTPPPNPPTPPPLPPPPKERRKHLPIDPNDIPHFPINDYEYYKEIKQLLVLDKYPDGVSDNYKIHLRKRARHYLIIDSVLYHNPKKPKKVIMRKLEQMNLLESTHVSPDSGIHLGILKMLDLIHGEYFWRGLYEDVASFVNNCPKCRDSVDLAQRREKEFRRLGVDFSDDEMEYAYATSAVQTSSIVWARVEIQLHGPFKITENRNEFILTITDPESCFVHATALPRIGCAMKITDFILKTFYTFGFPQPCFINDKKLYDEVVVEYDSRLKQTAWKTKLHWKECSECPWVSQLAELLIVRKTDRWDKEMDKFMFQFRAGCIRDAPSPKDSMPFYSMFQRLPYLDKENVEVWIKGRNHLQCAECDDIFISKVGLRLHKKQHFLEEARKTSLLEYAMEKHESQEGGEVEKSRVEVAMGEIKNYLAKTKDMRRRRGKYQKYSVEIQEHMIVYAKKHGTKKAASYFSQLIGSNVSDSTIRNLLKASVHFLPRTKEEIARYAIEFGIDKASKYFTEILNKDVPPSLVNKFRILYGGKFLKKDKDNSDKHKKNKNEKMINNLTDEEKDSIGNHACDHTTQETINYFDEKLNIKLSESDVKEFQKTYLDKQEKSNFFETSTESVNVANVTYQNLPAGNVCFSPSGSIVEIQDTSYSFEDIGYHEALQYQEDTRSIQPENTQQQLEQSVEESAVVDHFLLLSDESPTSCEINISDKPENSRKSQEWNNQCYQVTYEERPVLQEEVPPSDFQSKVNEVTSIPSSDSTIDHKESKRKPKKKEVGKKRGSYTTYSPELRAKIGKYAAEHSTLKASNHFSKILGHDLPESTARGLKERYLSKVRHCDVTSLGFSVRGRPLRLGKYDEIVQECLKELVRSGERMTSFLAITTARQILNKLEPSLLHENGGTIILNTTWAKSILKRIGVRNNS